LADFGIFNQAQDDELVKSLILLDVIHKRLFTKPSQDSIKELYLITEQVQLTLPSAIGRKFFVKNLTMLWK
jgi:hypothetical protein